MMLAVPCIQRRVLLETDQTELGVPESSLPIFVIERAQQADPPQVQIFEQAQ